MISAYCNQPFSDLDVSLINLTYASPLTITREPSPAPLKISGTPMTAWTPTYPISAFPRVMFMRKPVFRPGVVRHAVHVEKQRSVFR